MDYQYENLGSEKFQFLCQALLTNEFPNVQCFPIAQSDGGRDAISYVPSKGNEYNVFQVKFVRNPQSQPDPHKWLLEIVKAEAPKVKKLLGKGAKSYYLLTNVPGTAHPDVGTIDQVQSILDEKLGIPSMCWWRNDLNRRLDLARELRWSYPELLTGIDIMRMLVEAELTEHKERRTNAIRAFLRDQYQTDTEVRFKQVELQNRLLDLFVDVPILLRQHQENKKQSYINFQIMRNLNRHNSNTDDDAVLDEEMHPLTGNVSLFSGSQNPSIGAATFLLHSNFQSKLNRIVLEGAPGQGKSTIGQYICQVHRMHILQMRHDLDNLSEAHRNAPVCLPFKVDLRDLATWLSKKDPFSGDETEIFLLNWRKSLEAFLAAQVHHHSGGADFDVSDLLAVTKLSPVLLVLDGLDEIADIARRREVVEEISRGVSRLEENTASLQVVVTSRPAAFANSPGLPEDKFPHYQLDSLTRQLIDAYTNKWTRAKRLTDKEGSEVKKILKSKLSQPHLRDLSRNPMQLAILLSLIHTRGSSLPDKRTALYDNYVDMFFNREAEKSDIVRDKRDLLIDIHGYLAWILHSEAESGDERGSISQERLRGLLTSYLEVEGHDVSLAEKLFAGMVERVVALVSRVEGTFEFEVQPLREYFAARYLYETAQYSPTGAERGGTKPDRFDALARNFYWLNVTRFFAGRFDKGELPSLVDRLRELVTDNTFRFTSHPRMLAAILLGDWVFTQYPRSLREVISIVVDGLGLRYVLSTSNKRFSTGSPLVLPPQCGNEDLISYCFSILKTSPARDYALDTIELIKSNSTVEHTKDLWLENMEDPGTKRTTWIDYGLNLEVLPRLSFAELEKFMLDNPLDSTRLNILFRGRCLDYCSHSETTFGAVLANILDGETTAPSQRRPETALELISHTLDPRRYHLALELRRPVALSHFWKENTPFAPLTLNWVKETPKYDATSRCLQVATVAMAEAEKTAEEWATSLTPWDRIVEASRSQWGDQWITYQFANIACGIKSTSDKASNFAELFDHSKSLCQRTRYARLRSSSTIWWQKQLESANTETEHLFALMVFLSWAKGATITSLIYKLDESINMLSPQNWKKLASSIRLSFSASLSFSTSYNYMGSEKYLLRLDLDALPLDISARTATILAMRSRADLLPQIFTKYLNDYSGDYLSILEFCQQQAIYFVTNSSNWRPYLDIISRAYRKGSHNYIYAFQQLLRSSSSVENLDPICAEEIASRPYDFPDFLIAFAEAKCRQIASTKVVPVALVATRDKWFL